MAEPGLTIDDPHMSCLTCLWERRRSEVPDSQLLQRGRNGGATDSLTRVADGIPLDARLTKLFLTAYERSWRKPGGVQHARTDARMGELQLPPAGRRIFTVGAVTREVRHGSRIRDERSGTLLQYRSARRPRSRSAY